MVVDAALAVRDARGPVGGVGVVGVAGADSLFFSFFSVAASVAGLVDPAGLLEALDSATLLLVAAGLTARSR